MISDAVLAGLSAGMIKTSVGHPFDTVKVRMQTNPDFKGPFECLLRTMRVEGIRGLYKGLLPPMLGTGVTDSIMFTTATFVQRSLRKNLNIETLELKHNMFSGLCGGLAASLGIAPIEQVKSRLQVQYEVDKSQRLYKGPIDCVIKTIQREGVTALWRGLIPTMMFRVHNAIYIGSYYYYQAALRKFSDAEALISFLCGGTAATTCWAVGFPFDTIKCKMMAQPIVDGKPSLYPTVWACFRETYREGGIRSFYRGYVPCLVRSFPANGAGFLAFETMTKLQKKFGKE